MEYSFGKFLEDIRTNRYHLSRKALCADICSDKQLERIEKDLSQPSIYILHQLSSRLNLDLYDYYKNQHLYTNKEAASLSQQLHTLITNNPEKALLLPLIEKAESIPDFSTGYYHAVLCYAKAAYLDEVQHNTEAAIATAVEGIQAETPEFNLQTFKNTVLSEMGYNLLNFIGGSYMDASHFVEAKNILNYLVSSIETFYLKEDFQSYSSFGHTLCLYQAALYQLALLFQDENDFSSSLELVEKNFNFSSQYNMGRLLPELFQVKYQLLYEMKDYTNSRTAFLCSTELFKAYGFPDISQQICQQVKNQYPLIAE